jgi:hypothetical protein
MSFLLLVALTSCWFAIDKVPVKLCFSSAGFLVMILHLEESFLHTVYYIWKNQHILYNNKSLFLEYWFRNDILLERQPVNAESHLLHYDSFLSLYKIPLTPKEFTIILFSIPSGVALLFRSMLRPSEPTFDYPC